MTDPDAIHRLCDSILSGAVQSGADEIHIEPGATDLRVRYRTGGELYVTLARSRDGLQGILLRFKELAGLDIHETRLPQHGRMRLGVNGRVVDFSVDTIATVWGERVFMVVHHGPSRPPLEIDTLGLPGAARQALVESLGFGEGLILVCGPTFSGKTVTLYAALEALDRERLRVVTAESPIQRRLDGVMQTQTRPGQNFSFAHALRLFVNQGADAILVQELRDGETALLALQAASRGSLVLSMVPAHNATAAVVRLCDMGASLAQIASATTLVQAQRLVRKLCAGCKTPWTPSSEELASMGVLALQERHPDLEVTHLHRAVGCARCDQSGFLGYELVAESLPIGPELKGAIAAGASYRELGQLRRRLGLPSLREAGLLKAIEGRTTVEEVMVQTPGDT